jgi:hypothetical protein
MASPDNLVRRSTGPGQQFVMESPRINQISGGIRAIPQQIQPRTSYVNNQPTTVKVIQDPGKQYQYIQDPGKQYQYIQVPQQIPVEVVEKPVYIDRYIDREVPVYNERIIEKEVPVYN